jgi:hypothetical protein
MNIRIGLFLASVLVALVIAPVVGVLPALLMLFVVGNLLGGNRTGQLCVTLTTKEILQLTIEAFKTSLPMLNRWSTDFSSQSAVKDEEIIAHIRSVPTMQDYDATNGFKANAANAEDLLTDIKVTMDKLRHPPVKIDFLTGHTSRKNLVKESTGELGYALGKDVVDNALAKVTDTNVTNEITESYANTSLETLERARTTMNTKKASRKGRIGIVNSSFAQALGNDSRIASRDFYGQLNGNDGYRIFLNVAGFEAIYEYPELPANSINLSAFFTAPQGVVIASRQPNIVPKQAADLGIPQIAKFEAITDPNTGLTLLGIAWQESGTFDVYVTNALLYGTAVGTQGGAADAVVDRACLKVVTA